MPEQDVLFLIAGQNPPQLVRLKLSTSEGRDIDNYQLRELDTYDVNQFSRYESGNFVGVEFIGNPTPVYNCHGFVFASRRTNIDSNIELRKILTDDKYIRIDHKDVLIGDVILYVSKNSGEIVHIGMVVDVNKQNPVLGTKILSKWGKYKEAIHPYQVCEYIDDSFLEFWRSNYGFNKSK